MHISCMYEGQGVWGSMEASSEQRRSHAKKGFQEEAGWGGQGTQRGVRRPAGKRAPSKVRTCGSTGTFLNPTGLLIFPDTVLALCSTDDSAIMPVLSTLGGSADEPD